MGFIIGVFCSVDVHRKQWQGRAGEVPRQKKLLCRVVSGRAPRAATHPKPQSGVAGWRKRFSIIDWKYCTVAVDSGRDGRDASRDKFVRTQESVREKQRETLPSKAQFLGRMPCEASASPEELQSENFCF